MKKKKKGFNRSYRNDGSGGNIVKYLYVLFIHETPGQTRAENARRTGSQTGFDRIEGNTHVIIVISTVFQRRFLRSSNIVSK